MLPGLTDGAVAPPDELLWRLVKGRTAVERPVDAAQEPGVHMRQAMLATGRAEHA